jgi:uncharacterized protein DUF4388
MSFTGDLEHLPVVDVIQLLHATKKSGTLSLRSSKGESQLVFNDGYIVSANHLNNSPRIGQILVEMNTITRDEVEKALLEQKNAGEHRLPLIATLLENGKINKEDAYKGLETLIEMTIVDVLTWTKGTFALDVDKLFVSDEYRYFPEKLHQNLHMNTQSVLMDALRIYDEKMRDGTLAEETFSAVEAPAEGAFDTSREWQDISADDLGLDDLDNLERKIPDVFLGVKNYDPTEIHRQKIRDELRGIPVTEQEKFFSFMDKFSGTSKTVEAAAASDGLSQALILFSQDEFIKHAVKTVCTHEGFYVFTTDEEVNLDLIIDQSLAKGLMPALVIAPPEKAGGRFSEENILRLLQEKLEKYPQVSVFQLVAQDDYDFSLRALQAGVTAVFPSPGVGERKDTFVADTITFIEAFLSRLKRSFAAPDPALRQFRDCIFSLNGLKDAPDVSFVLLRFASAMFERSITFIVGKSELTAERGIGVKADKSTGATPPMRFKIPLAQPSVFRDVIESGKLFCGQTDDALAKSHLFAEIGAPHSPHVLLAPLKSFGRVIALIYGDFGSKAASPPQIELLDILAQHAGLVLDNALYRKKINNPAQAQ